MGMGAGASRAGSQKFAWRLKFKLYMTIYTDRPRVFGVKGEYNFKRNFIFCYYYILYFLLLLILDVYEKFRGGGAGRWLPPQRHRLPLSIIEETEWSCFSLCMTRTRTSPSVGCKVRWTSKQAWNWRRETKAGRPAYQSLDWSICL